ncbi:hypothetical protein SH2C18_34770 [Clostridium sediminicola]|uniref:hypothetical protein n=1 Tax=Clostridium sediminicola TaxID=3114879 RepID=UPI0031F225BB
MRIRKNLLISSVIVVLITVPLLPCFYSAGYQFMFGYPLPYFTIYDYALIMKYFLGEYIYIH